MPDADSGNFEAVYITTEQIAELQDGLDETGANIQAFCKYMGVGSLAEIPSLRFKQAQDAIEAKRRDKAKGAKK